MSLSLQLSHSRSQWTFPAFRSTEQTRKNEGEALVDYFIQITVFRPSDPRLDAFVYKNAGKVYYEVKCLLLNSEEICGSAI